MIKRITCLMMVVAMLGGVASVRGESPASAPAYPDSVEGLQQWTQDLLAASAARDQARLSAIFQALVLPDYARWFERNFGETVGGRLSAEYAETIKTFPGAMTRIFLQLNEPLKLKVEVTSVEQPDDPGAKIFQRLLLAAMDNPTALYTATIYKEGTNARISIWSIVYVDGSFRFIGQTRAIHAPPRRGSSSD